MSDGFGEHNRGEIIASEEGSLPDTFDAFGNGDRYGFVSVTEGIVAFASRNDVQHCAEHFFCSVSRRV
jgi:hypothetical protein